MLVPLILCLTAFDQDQLVSGSIGERPYAWAILLVMNRVRQRGTDRLRGGVRVS